MQKNDDLTTLTKIPNELAVIALETPIFPNVNSSIDLPQNHISLRLFKSEETPKFIVFSKINRNKKNLPISKIESINNFEKIGVLAQVISFKAKPNGNLSLNIFVHQRVLLSSFNKENWTVKCELIETTDNESIEGSKIEASFKRELNKALAFIEKGKIKISKEVYENLKKIYNISDLIDYIAHCFPFKAEDRQNILNATDLKERINNLSYTMGMLVKELEFQDNLMNKMNTNLLEDHKKVIIRNQIQNLKKELSILEKNDSKGEVEEKSDFETFSAKAKKIKKITKEGRDTLNSELKKFQGLNPASSDYNVSKNFIETVIKFPWDKKTKDILDVKRARKHLDEEHFGMENVKRRILQYLAVAQKKKNIKGNILCLAGPPGVGKTSLGKSIATALGRKYRRISLGGVRDESEMRGHRRTYVGAMPGKFVKSMISANVSNPVIVLDEIDKLGRSQQGDPASALLEILDPEQNSSFVDHYLDMPIDLSNVFFIATANDLANIPGPLRDRMEIINVSSYTELEKIEIADRYLVDRQKENNGLNKDELNIDREAIRELINGYTRESGVRNLQRMIGEVCRSAVEKLIEKPDLETVVIGKDNLSSLLKKKPMFKNNRTKSKLNPGVATGLAWSQVGGSLLYIESLLVPGNKGIKLTGKLGDVIQESAAIALSCLRSKSKSHKIDLSQLENNQLHIHFPEGATPKDGPSAGITLFSALFSLLSNKPIDSKTAFTGEITLSGDVLPVGGIREKVLAAKRHGMKTLVLSKENESDIDDLEDNIKKGIKIHFVDDIEELIRIVF